MGTDRVDTEKTRQIAQGLSELRRRTHALRIETRELEQQLKGATCTTLRLVLAAQVHELGRAEAQLAGTGLHLGGTHCVTRTEPSPDRSTSPRVRVDGAVSSLLDGHVAASKEARSAARGAREIGDGALYEVLAHRADAHDAAECTLAPLMLSSIVSCQVCPARDSCPLSAAMDDDGLRSTTPGCEVEQRTVDFEDIRTELLAEHADLRKRIDEAREAAVAVSSGRSNHGHLQSLTDDLAGALRAHNDREEELLGEVLPTLDAWGHVRREIMTEQHISEHGELADAVEGLDSLFQRTAREAFIATLDRVLEHMEREEKTVLNDPLLRELGSEPEQVSG
jgi:hypothetical protein